MSHVRIERVDTVYVLFAKNRKQKHRYDFNVTSRTYIFLPLTIIHTVPSFVFLKNETNFLF